MTAQDPLEVGVELTGRLLVATPELGEGTFERSVVLVLDHDEDGALGVVINRPTPVDVAEVLPAWQPLASEPGVLFQGGPVALDSALGLAVIPGRDEDEEPLGWRRVVGRLGLVDLDTPPEVLAAGVTRLRIFAGYAGWAGGQLEDELREGAWYVVPASPGGGFEDAFSTTPDTLWRTVLRRQGGDLAMVSTYLADPSLN
ncbi:MAG TPA: YqgE/AlgH family protein [Actinomycetes bacterium]|jgi:putative transcriptional regulator